MLQDLKFDNRFIRELPGDPKKDNERRQVMQACYSLVMPKSTAAPQIVAYSKAQVRHPIHEPLMGLQCYVHRYANSCVAKQCIT
jgi:hypothetical protein